MDSFGYRRVEITDFYSNRTTLINLAEYFFVIYNILNTRAIISLLMNLNLHTEFALRDYQKRTLGIID